MTEENKNPSKKEIHDNLFNGDFVKLVELSLLKKYMQHIKDCEGEDFVFMINSFPSDIHFSKEETELLERLSEELDNDQ